MPKYYHGYRTKEGDAEVEVVTDRSTPLEFRLEQYAASPDGFEWGYPGSGPSQLAFCLLMERREDVAFARSASEYFRDRFVRQLPREGWTLTEDELETLVCLTEIKMADTVITITRQKLAGKPVPFVAGLYFCSVCGLNTVRPLDGCDTCDTCVEGGE